MPSTLTIREESPADYDDIDRVHRFAFGGDAEALIVCQLRAAGLVISSLVAVTDELVGHVLFSRLRIQTRKRALDVVALGPVGVAPELQRNGIGAALIENGLDRCRRGEAIVIVVGHPEYYSRFGFSAEQARRLESAFRGEVWMALELQPAALEGVSGVVQYPPSWGIDERRQVAGGEAGE